MYSLYTIYLYKEIDIQTAIMSMRETTQIDQDVTQL